MFVFESIGVTGHVQIAGPTGLNEWTSSRKAEVNLGKRMDASDQTSRKRLGCVC